MQRVLFPGWCEYDAVNIILALCVCVWRACAGLCALTFLAAVCARRPNRSVKSLEPEAQDRFSKHMQRLLNRFGVPEG